MRGRVDFHVRRSSHKMASNFEVTFGRRLWIMNAIALLLLLLLTQGSATEENTILPSSQQKRDQSSQNSISIQISESLRDTRTLDEKLTNDKKISSDNDNKQVIITTEMISDSSYLNKDTKPERLETQASAIPSKKKRHLDDGNKMNNDVEFTAADEFRIPESEPGNYYDAIKPTKTISPKEEKISSTDISGEAKGVSMKESGPRNTNYDRKSRKPTKDRNAGKNYNQVGETLGKIAKIRINHREGRDEDRKANPDIQDIITGIVKILNGNANNQGGSDGSAGRPLRPTNTRINNRGPPRISDVPPLEFDGPPFVPPNGNVRVPPPYPFDVPPPLSNVPLPPQPPSKSGSNLPLHPFIEGVPIPEVVVPNKPHPEATSEYDTISMSEHGLKPPPLLTLNTTKPNGTTKNDVKFSSMNNNSPQNVDIAQSNASFENERKNVTMSKPDKNKLNGQKISMATKTPIKRPRPRPPGYRPRPLNGTRIGIKPIPLKNVTTVEDKNLTQGYVNVTERPTEQTIIAKTEKPEVTTLAFGEKKVNVTQPTNVTQDQLSAFIKNVLTDIFNGTERNVTKNVGVKNGTEKIDLELPVLLESSDGIGEATPVLESSIPEITTSITGTSAAVTSTTKPEQSTRESTQYKARPGIVLDDPEYKPGGHKRPVITSRPIITAPPPHKHYGEIFDVTVHAVQGPGDETSSGKPYIFPVEIDGVQIQTQAIGDVITKPQEGQDFVSIDGKRTYINLFGESASKIAPTSTQSPITGTGFAVPHKDSPVHQSSGTKPTVSTSPPVQQNPARRPYKKPSHPPVRIDTCIVGDDTTCDSAQNEMCRTEDGVSSCHCRPGYNRRKHRDPCRHVVSMLTSLRVDRLYDRKVRWQENLRDPESEAYQQLSYEASQAMESAMSMTPFSDDFINSRINSIYAGKNVETNEPAVYINMTIELEENLDTLRPAVKNDIQRHLIRVIQRRNNNVGNSAVWVDSPPGSVLALQDVDECSSRELHDCHEKATCSNTFGSFKCQCPNGFRDPWVGNIHRQGRLCESCAADYCNNRGECKYENGQQICHCAGSFYGAQCEIDGEVLGVAIGASVAAAIIIILTLVCLCMWSRRWSREQKSVVGAGMGSPVFGYMATGPTVKTPSVGGPPYQVSIEDRIRWAQIADVMAQANHYAQPEPGTGTTRTSFGGYPSLPSHAMSMAGTLPLPAMSPPVPLPRLNIPNKGALSTYGGHSQHGSIHQSTHGMRTSLDTTSSSEEEDRADLLGRNFNASRPKSRTSIANQSGIYYDVDFDRSDIYNKQNTIAMSTYTLNPQLQTRPYFR